MLFNSLSFLLFFPAVTAGYYFLPFRLRWMWLLGASCVFYMAFIPQYLLILGGTIVIDYFAGLWIERAPVSRKKLYLIISIISNVGVLAVFKYGNFLIENFNTALVFLGAANRIPLINIVLPIGLSFHTFQAMSYTIEVYRGHQRAERHFGLYALYVMFYPQLVAGPIERPQNILPQLKVKHAFTYENAADGLKLMAWGFFQKVVVADRLAVPAGLMFNDPTHFNSRAMLIAAVAFTFQIYLDFAGYSNIAIGAAQVMGIKLMTNFRRPFLSTSISEFWKRWHISLSTWFRDYLYIPLGGNRMGKSRSYLNLLIVFLVSGLWHGASWNFVIWGALHGLYLVTALITAPLMPEVLNDNTRWPVRLWNRCWVFALVCIAFVFFRAATLHDAFYIVSHVLADPRLLLSHGPAVASLQGTNWHDLGVPAVGLVIILVAEFLQERHGSLRALFGMRPIWVRWPAYAALVYATVLLCRPGSGQFIYFQF